MGGVLVYTTSEDAGPRWSVMNTAGQPLRTIDTRDLGVVRSHAVVYDALMRPTEVLFEVEGSAAKVMQRTVYGEAKVDVANTYHRGRAWQVFDGAGLAQTDIYNFKGQPLTQKRQLLQVVTANDVDWSASASPALESDVYSSHATYDALNRLVNQTSTDGSVTRHEYNVAGLLERVWLKHIFDRLDISVVSGIDYSAKGQRLSVVYDDSAQSEHRGCTSTYLYDPKTFRIRNITTTRQRDNVKVQDLSYVYDPAGNITSIADAAIQTVFFNSGPVEASNDYFYDSLSRLTWASGREHVNQGVVPPRGDSSVPTATVPDVGDSTALRRYLQSYSYDHSGNLTQLRHRANAGNWTRDYTYHTGTNRLATTNEGSTTLTYNHDSHGNFQTLGDSSTKLTWNYRDELVSFTASVGSVATTVYHYDAGGQRVRKVTSTGATKTSETIYLGSFEVVRNFSGGAETRVETLHLSDGQSRVCMVERKFKDAGVTTSTPANWRYQFSNHLGSASIELDADGNVISYEEYHPYGTTSYRAHRPGGVGLSLKRYRYTGKERDGESGLYYHGARYYAAWLGRWTAADPIGIGDGLNRFAYVRGNPVRLSDPGGTTATDEQKQERQVPVGAAKAYKDESPASATARAIQSGFSGIDNTERALIEQEISRVKGGWIRDSSGVAVKGLHEGDKVLATLPQSKIEEYSARFNAKLKSRGTRTVSDTLVAGRQSLVDTQGSALVAVEVTSLVINAIDTITIALAGGKAAGALLGEVIQGVGQKLAYRQASSEAGQWLKSPEATRNSIRSLMAEAQARVQAAKAGRLDPNIAVEASLKSEGGAAGGAIPVPGRVQSRINVASGQTRFTPLRPTTGQPVSAGFDHVLKGHFNVPLTNSRSVFSISPNELKTLLQSKQVVGTPVVGLEGGQFLRIADTHQIVGNSALKFGGEQTTKIAIYTDRAGNLITTYPVP